MKREMDRGRCGTTKEKEEDEGASERSGTSGRDDDNLDSLKKRFVNFRNEQMPIINKFQSEGKVIEINAHQSQQDVFEDVKEAVKNVF